MCRQKVTGMGGSLNVSSVLLIITIHNIQVGPQDRNTARKTQLYLLSLQLCYLCIQLVSSPL